MEWLQQYWANVKQCRDRWQVIQLVLELLRIAKNFRNTLMFVQLGLRAWQACCLPVTKWNVRATEVVYLACGLVMSAILWNRKSLTFIFLNFVWKSNCDPTYANKTFFSRDFATFGHHLFTSNFTHNRDNVPRQILITQVSTKMLTWIRLADMISYELALSLWIRSCCDWCFSQAMETVYIVFAFSTVRYF